VLLRKIQASRSDWLPGFLPRPAAPGCWRIKQGLEREGWEKWLRLRWADSGSGKYSTTQIKKRVCVQQEDRVLPVN
jgi:hypothetical protein